MAREVIAALDIGTSMTRCVLAEQHHRGEISIVAMHQLPSKGLRKGIVIDVEACAGVINSVISTAERTGGVRASSVHVGLSPLHATVSPSKGAVSVQGNRHIIDHDDLARVAHAASMVAVPPTKELIAVVPRQYIVDGESGISDPLRMEAMSLELDALAVLGHSVALNILRDATDRAGYAAASFVLKPLALGELILTADEREMGVLLADIGAGLTETAYFQGGAIKSVGVVPLGGSHVTSDMAIGLKISTAIAEQLKTELDWFATPEDKWFDLQAFGHVESRRIQAGQVVEVVEPRLLEILDYTRQQGQTMSGLKSMPAGTVLTGKTIKTRALARLAEGCLGGAVRVKTDAVGGGNDAGFNVAHAVSVYVLSQRRQRQGDVSGKRTSRLLDRVKGVWQDIWE